MTKKQVQIISLVLSIVSVMVSLATYYCRQPSSNFNEVVYSSEVEENGHSVKAVLVDAIND